MAEIVIGNKCFFEMKILINERITFQIINNVMEDRSLVIMLTYRANQNSELKTRLPHMKSDLQDRPKKDYEK